MHTLWSQLDALADSEDGEDRRDAFLKKWLHSRLYFGIHQGPIQWCYTSPQWFILHSTYRPPWQAFTKNMILFFAWNHCTSHWDRPPCILWGFLYSIIKPSFQRERERIELNWIDIITSTKGQDDLWDFQTVTSMVDLKILSEVNRKKGEK